MAGPRGKFSGGRATKRRRTGDAGKQSERVVRFDPVPEEEDPEEDSNDEEDDEEEGFDPSAAAPQAYDALVTLLASNEPAKPKKMKRSAPVTETDDLAPVLEDGDNEETLEEPMEVDEEDASDPFEQHFASSQSDVLDQLHKAVTGNKWTTTQAENAVIGKMTVLRPENVEQLSGTPPTSVTSLNALRLKQRVLNAFTSTNSSLTPLQSALAAPIFNYLDLLHTGRTHKNAEEIRTLYTLHALNHLYKTRDRVLKNNARLAHAAEDDDLELRDQGFTRPKVLFVLPTRNACLDVVNTLIPLSGTEQQENKKRFMDNFTVEKETISEAKPEDFRALFAGNDDDMFRVGIKFTRKTMKFFADFYNSDIILASPLGLRMAIGAEGDKKRDFDFLSSIELVIIDQADSMLMQNWEHVEHLFAHMNLIPKDPHGCDFSRVRSWYLDDRARFMRQTLVFTQYNTPELNALFNKDMRNLSGKVKTRHPCEGSINDVGAHIRQNFLRMDLANPADDPDVRFKHFITGVLPGLLRSSGNGGLMIFIPSYFDFVRLRNHLESIDASVAALSEYTKGPDVARGRTLFAQGRKKIMLYTERAHHFRRYDIKGVTSLYMYGLPEHPQFYPELVRFLARSVAEGIADQGAVKCRGLFTKFDALKLERIVGTKRAGAMCSPQSSGSFEFY
ncbi:rRNA-binding ribosome biosynthesis protein utp25 [Saitoella coloradoensis]